MRGARFWTLCSAGQTLCPWHSTASGSSSVFVVFFLVRLASRGGVGYGDIKMITAAALILGIYGTFSFLLVSHVLAAVAAIALLVSKKATRKDGLPFGPFFYLGYLVTIFDGNVLIKAQEE